MKFLSSRTTRIIIFVFLVLCVGVGGFAFSSSRSSDPQAIQDNPIPAAKPRKTTTTQATVPVPNLPQPQDSPVDPYEKVPINEMGTIEIPKIGLKTKAYEGVWLTVVNVGPGHWPGTAQPGEYGNTVFAGHRVTHSKPFRKIDDLVNGDEIVVTTSTGRHVYKVTGHEIVEPNDIWIVDQTPGYRITLFACHPPGSAAQRYVVYGDLVDPPEDATTSM